MSATATTSTGTTVVKTACQLCMGGCGMDVHLEEGKIVKINGSREHPINRGRLCPKGAAALDWARSPERLRYPLKREGDGWKRISWDEALDTIVTKLKAVKQDYGARAFAVGRGMVFLNQGRASIELMQRFTDVYGTPNTFSVDSICYRCRLIGYILTLGRWGIADIENSRCVLVWGNNPDASTPPWSWSLAQARQKGARVMVIDPRKTPWAKKADLHLQPRPGSDTALALALLQVIISEGLYDRDFVERWTVGFDHLAEHVKDYTPEKVEGITWVPAERIREAARLLATIKPAAILQGWNALDHAGAALQNSRAVAILMAITGNFDVPGGFITPPGLRLPPLRLLEKMEGRPLGAERFPLHYEVLGRLFGEGQTMLLAETLLTGKPYPIKAMIVAGTNPVLTWPDTARTREALGKLDFLVVMDMFLTETARLAHLVLPAASFLERTELTDLYPFLGQPYITLRKRVMQFEESWPDVKFWLELGKRMGYQDYFPWKDGEELLDYMLQPLGLSVRHLTEVEPVGRFYAQQRYREYQTKGLRTPSGKAELYSKTLEELGYDPLPTYREPAESPLSRPDLLAEYPLILTTGARVREYLHSQLRNVPRLRRAAPYPVVEIHPDTARACRVEDGQAVLVRTRKGSIEVRARVTGDILAGVVNVAHGWEEANVNLLTDGEPSDPVTGNPTLKALLCRIEPSPPSVEGVL